MSPVPPEGREDQLLRASVWGGVVFAVGGVVWGLAAGSTMILFDGLYSSISVALSLLSLIAFRAVQRGPDARYHYGRDAMSSLVVVVKGVAIGALSLFALGGAVLDLLAGGREVAVGSAALYAALATVGCGAMTLLLRRSGTRHGSELLRAESAQWSLDTALSAAVLVGFLGALAAQARGRDDVAALIDPSMVAVLSLAFLALPVRLIRQGLRGTLAAAPEAHVQEALGAVVTRVADAHGFARTSCRIAVFGERYDLTVGLLADEGTDLRDLADADRVRAELQAALDELPYDLLLSVSITGDERWLD
ncbi:MAG: cation diffusion facilitator family transporter [Nitriliruptoraceae bacterium]